MKTRLLASTVMAVTLGVVGAWRRNAQGPVKVELKNAVGASVGTATLTAATVGVAIALDVKSLPPGEHAIHVHQVAKCEAPEFTTAGGHFNPDNKKHGIQNPDGPHAGDMNNFTVAASGTAKVTVTDERISLGTGPK